MDFIAGSVAGIASTIAVHPLDVIRTRVQVGLFPNVSTALSRTVREEGFRALYKGLLPPVLAQAVYKSIIFGSTGLVRDNFPNLPVVVHGMVGGAANCLVVTPVELVRNRLMVQRGAAQQLGALAVINNVVKTNGVTGLWRGLLPTLYRDCPGVGFWIWGFSSTKTLLSSDAQPLSLPRRLVAGAAAGVCFWAWALPFDTLKSLVQAEAAPSMWSAFLQVRAQHGVGHLYRAWPAAIGRGIPAAAITLTSYDLAMEWLRRFQS